MNAELLAKLDAITLESGSHSSVDSGMCAMEAAAWIAGEPHSDHPQCVSPSISAFLRSWNDSLNDTDRQLLKQYVVKSLNTRTTPEDEQTRAFLAMDWLVRTFTPTWLELANLGTEAAALRALAPMVSAATLIAAQPALNAGRDKAAAARDAAWAAAGDAARDAAGAAAWDAAWAAARDAAWAAAGDAARDAAGAAAWAAAWDAAWAAARDAAWAAAWDAAWAAARDAAWAALRGTVERLQQSAFSLLDRMIAVGAVQQ